ncbi:hypothetical protein H0H81_007120, partial [Sphagnurus paluster]
MLPLSLNWAIHTFSHSSRETLKSHPLILDLINEAVNQALTAATPPPPPPPTMEVDSPSTPTGPKPTGAMPPTRGNPTPPAAPAPRAKPAPARNPPAT